MACNPWALISSPPTICPLLQGSSHSSTPTPRTSTSICIRTTSTSCPTQVAFESQFTATTPQRTSTGYLVNCIRRSSSTANSESARSASPSTRLSGVRKDRWDTSDNKPVEALSRASCESDPPPDREVMARTPKNDENVPNRVKMIPSNIEGQKDIAQRIRESSN